MCWFFLGKYWKAVEPYVVPVDCALAETQKQEREETETVSALASLSVDVEQCFPQEESRYVYSTGNTDDETFYCFVLFRRLLGPDFQEHLVNCNDWLFGCLRLRKTSWTDIKKAEVFYISGCLWKVCMHYWLLRFTNTVFILLSLPPKDPSQNIKIERTILRWKNKRKLLIDWLSIHDYHLLLRALVLDLNVPQFFKIISI